MVCVEGYTPGGFSFAVPKRLTPERWNILTFDINLWVIVSSSFYWRGGGLGERQ